MELEDLQRAALCPSRWDRLIERYSVPAESTEYSSVEPLVTAIGKIDSGDWHYLTPGGRYLVTSKHYEDVLYLWDLGIPGRPPFDEPLLITSVTWDFRGRQATIVGAVVDSKIRVARTVAVPTQG